MEYKCYCRKPRRQDIFIAPSVDEAKAEAAKRWGITPDQVIASRYAPSIDSSLNNRPSNWPSSNPREPRSDHY